MHLQFPLAALAIVLAACSSKDFSGESNTSSSSGNASSSTATGAGGSGASGTTGGGGAASECAADSACTPDPPDGWTGPALLYTGTAPPKSCDAPWKMALEAGNFGAIDAPFECGACMCGAPSGVLCSQPNVSVYAGGNCMGAGEAHQLADGACTEFVNAGYGAIAGAIAPAGGTCVASGGRLTASDPTWAESAIMCEGAPAGDACSAGHCVAAPTDPFAKALCVYREGEEDCPTGFADKTVFYRETTDTRGCAACACGTPAGASCADAIHVWNDAACSDPAIPPTLLADGTCQHQTYYIYMAFTAAAAGGTCEASGGDKSGDVQPAAPVTVCCNAL